MQITAGEIVRAEDGLALSSRNSFLDEDERPRASQLYKSLRWVEAQILEGRRDYMTLAEEAAEQLEAAGFKVDYMSIRQSRTLMPAAHDDREVTILGAMYTRGARLIDNISMQVPAGTLEE